MSAQPTILKDELRELAERLSPLEKQLLLGECDGWGSWMFDAGEYLCSLGLGTIRSGSIAFDTPLAARLTAALRARASIKGSSDATD